MKQFLKQNLPLAVFVACLSFFLFFSFRGLNVPDEGQVMYGAGRILDGGVLYRDSFQAHGPGVFYWTAAVFYVFGRELAFVRIFYALVVAAGAVFLFLLANRVANAPWAVLAAAIFALYSLPLASSPTLSWYSISFALGSIFFVARYVDTGRLGDLAVGGVLGGAAFFFKQNVGVYLFAAIGLFFVVLALVKKTVPARQFMVFSGAFSMLPLATLAYFFSQGALWDFLDQAFIRAILVNTGEMALQFPLPWSYLPSGLSLEWLYRVLLNSWYYLVLAAYLVELKNLFAECRSGARQDSHFLIRSLLVSCGFFLYLSMWPRPDRPHFLFSIPLFYVVGARLGSVLSGRGRIAAFLIAGVLLLGGVGLGLRVVVSNSVLLDLPHAKGIFVTPELAEEARGVVGYVRAHSSPGEPILVLPVSSMYYFLSDRDAPSRYYQFYPGEATSSEQEEVVNAAESKRVDLVVLGVENEDTPEIYRFEASSPVLYRWVSSNFRQAARFGTVAVLLRQTNQTVQK